MRLSWTPVSGATGYDVVFGNLQYLASAGSWFEGCLADDTPALSVSVNPDNLAENLFLLVRAVFGATNGTYDEGGNQVGPRDPHLYDCP
jgi:hypothetical protein